MLQYVHVSPVLNYHCQKPLIVVTSPHVRRGDKEIEVDDRLCGKCKVLVRTETEGLELRLKSGGRKYPDEQEGDQTKKEP